MIPTDGNVLVDFYADWCAPCASIAESLAEIEAEQTGLKVLRVNIEEQMELAIEHDVKSIPTLIMFKDGVETGRMVGASTKSAMVSSLGIATQ